MNVLKKNGSQEPIDITKIKKQTHFATLGLKGETAEEIEVSAQIHFYDGMPTSDIQKSLISAAESKIDIDRPNASYVAARLYTYDMYHEYLAEVGDLTFKSYIEYGVKAERLNPVLMEFDLDMYGGLIALSDDFIHDNDYLFTFAAIQSFSKKVLRRSNKGVLVELPQFAILANCIVQSYHEKDHFNVVKDLYALISSHGAMTATPTLGNARNVRPQLSSCYIGATPDNIEGIMGSNTDIALLSKFGGGVGWDWHDVRGMEAPVDNVAKASGGVVPFLKLTNDVAVAVDQLGCTDRDAEVIYVKNVTIDGEVIDLSEGIGALHRNDDKEALSGFVSNLAYLMDVEDKNKASLALSCLCV